MLSIVSYDIVEDKRRTKLAKRLCDFGKRVQYSVFECDLTKEQLNKMIKIALTIIEQEKDSLRIYQLCQTCNDKILSYGIKKGWEEDEIVVV